MPKQPKYPHVTGGKTLPQADKYDVGTLEYWLRVARAEGPGSIRIRACRSPGTEQQKGEEAWRVYCVLVKSPF